MLRSPCTPKHGNLALWFINMMLPRHFWILSVHSCPVTLKCILIAVQQQLTQKEAGLARVLDKSSRQVSIVSSPCNSLCLYLDAMKTVNIWFLENLNMQLQ
ncbi:hypothetical protein POTOM_004020 [Populus tomentosa]|uniref:Uncharacterized protein n=1 Tax=Populus tomentosa TaxID=118781 RepID=A0A8X8DEZ9_POPTO|nr:hypothetical protein POTOM_004020 [Populus tomentosa]